MFRRTDLALIAAMIGVVTYTYSVKNDTKHAAKELAAVERRIDVELNAIDVLTADWAVLTAPSRIQQLATIHAAELNLEGLAAERIVSIDAIPMRPEPAPLSDIDAVLARFGDGGEPLDGGLTDPSATGSITPAGEDQ
jgi:hypothetical protein